MIEQELKEIWRISSQTEQIKFDLSRLLIDLKHQMSRIDKSIRNRDSIEIAAAVFIIPIFGFMAYQIPFPVSKMGCIFIMIWATYVIYKLRRVKKFKRPVDLALSLREQLEKYRTYMQLQANLINSVFYWYLLPPFIGLVIIVSGADIRHEFILLLKAGYIALVIIIYAGILWINKRAVKKTLRPIIQDIEKAQDQLNSEK